MLIAILACEDCKQTNIVTEMGCHKGCRKTVLHYNLYVSIQKKTMKRHDDFDPKRIHRINDTSYDYSTANALARQI